MNLSVINKLKPYLNEEETAAVNNAIQELAPISAVDMLELYAGMRAPAQEPNFQAGNGARQKAALFVCQIQFLKLTGKLTPFEMSMEDELKELGQWDLLAGLKSDLDNVD